MQRNRDYALTRRGFMRGMAGAAALAAFREHPALADIADVTLTAMPSSKRLGPTGRETGIWAYDDAVPGPELRVRQGERLRVTVVNRLAQETTVHWHGLRVPNAMDGVPDLTQKPISPGDSFVYEFEAQDAGTFWYHPHARGFEQIERGLSGPLIVEERDPIKVDRDLTWMLDDWRLLPSGQLSEDFGNFMDASHGGRVGNVVTINGKIPDKLSVRTGERIRLRLINAANARLFALEFRDHDPIVVSHDGQPVAPHAPENGRIVLAPAKRVDLVVDFMGKPGSSFAVTDSFYRGLDYKLIDVEYGETPLRDAPLDAPIALTPNPLAEPNVASAVRHEIVLGGGMMGRMRSATMNGRPMAMMDMMRRGIAWAINGVAAGAHDHQPMLNLALGQSYTFALDNDTAWPHPMHLHGHAFRVLSRNGEPTRHREWEDTVLLAPGEKADIAFVADNPGDWMFHCHILEHQAAGMMAVIRVA